MKKTLLVIGDLILNNRNQPFDSSLVKFLRYRQNLIRRNIKYAFIGYDDVLLGRLPGITTRRLEVLLFFPYAYWNAGVERYDNDLRIYGDDKFGRLYKRFFKRVDKIIRTEYRDKSLHYINPPQSCVLDRDKRKTAQKLKKFGILTPREYRISNIRQLNKLLKKIGAFYIKPPFGAMGKGLTYLSSDTCCTNFVFRKDRIISRPYDCNWKFIKLSGRKRDVFLKQLLRKGFIFEAAVKHPKRKRRKFDIRVYVIYGSVPYFYARSAPSGRFLTNWSQGGRIEKKSFIKRALPPEKIDEIIALCKKCARVLALNYAGIDILLDKNLNIYFSEAHSFPGYERGFNLMKYLADKI
jgi:hypothetical protein